jgi:hypothetical protein
VARGAIATAAVLLCTSAGVGWLYLLFHGHLLAFGPRVEGALPLQQLAGSESQPLPRLVVAWLPAGLAAGILVASPTRLSRPGRAAAVAATAWAVLFVAGALSDAIALNERLGPHLAPQLSRAGTWMAVGLMVIGSLPAPPAGRARRGIGR